MRNANERGFTLVEVFLAASVVAAVIVGITALFILGMKTNAASGDQTSCVTLAQDRMEKLKYEPWDTIAVGGNIDTPVSGYSEQVDVNGDSRPDFQMAWAVAWQPGASSSLSAGAINVMDLNVRCTSLRAKNGQPGNPKQYTLSTYRSRGVE